MSNDNNTAIETATFSVGGSVRCRWIVGAEARTVGWVSRTGEWFAFAGALDETNRAADFIAAK